jgi:hypothetical protein
VKKGDKTQAQITEEIFEVKAPFLAGDTLGKLTISMGGEVVGEVNLVAVSGVAKETYLDIVNDLIEKW